MTTKNQDINFVALYPIDINSPNAQQSDLKGKELMVHSYIEGLIGKLLAESTNRSFKFRSKATEVRTAIANILNKEHEIAPQTIADRLLTTEKSVQNKYKQITTLLKGSLIESHIKLSGDEYILIAKIDHHSFLDEKELTKRVGIPFEKMVLKACLIPIDKDQTFEYVRVYDTNTKIADYWWREFLELEEERTDTQNTKNAFEALEDLISREVGKKHRLDFNVLRNALVFYFKNTPEMKYSDAVSYLFDKYTPNSKDVDAAKIKAKALALPQQKKFDQQFTIDATTIKRKYKKSIILRENLELVLKADVKDLAGIVEAYEDKGIRGIKIRTDEGWREFKK